MTQQRHSDYRSRASNGGAEQNQTTEAARLGARGIVEELGVAIRERPYTTLAIAAGLAFAVGAVWKLSQRQPPSRLESLLSQLPELPRRESLPRWWR